MDQKKSPEIYFHVGLGRTGTTFMQRSVFPKFKDIYYINKQQYRNTDDIIASTNYSKYLISHEFSKALIDEMKKFSATYPDAKIIVVFRRHDKWIASHYKRHLKNGYPKDFNGYFDLDNNTGLWKIEDLYYMPKIKCIEECFNHQPLILFHDELKENPQQFVQKILDFTGVKDTYPINYSPRHTSYSDKELKIRHWVNKHTIFKKIGVKNRKLSTLRRLYNKIVRYTTLYIARLIPEKMVSNKPLIAKEDLARIREFYKEDWEASKKYARDNNPLAEKVSQE